MAKHMEGVNVAYAVRGNRVERGTKVCCLITTIVLVTNKNIVINVPFAAQVSAQIIIGTPGTTLDWMFKAQAFDPAQLRVFVLDEADVMISEQVLFWFFFLP